MVDRPANRYIEVLDRAHVAVCLQEIPKPQKELAELGMAAISQLDEQEPSPTSYSRRSGVAQMLAGESKPGLDPARPVDELYPNRMVGGEPRPGGDLARLGGEPHPHPPMGTLSQEPRPGGGRARPGGEVNHVCSELDKPLGVAAERTLSQEPRPGGARAKPGGDLEKQLGVAAERTISQEPRPGRAKPGGELPQFCSELEKQLGVAAERTLSETLRERELNGGQLGHSESFVHLTVAKHREEMANQTIHQVWALSLCCGWWIPLLFVFAAVNVLDTCEQDLGAFLEVFGVVLLMTYPVSHTVAVIAARSNSHACVETTSSVICFLGLAFLAILIAGWVVWDQTSDGRCYDGWAVHMVVDINPRTFLLVWLMLSMVAVAGVLSLVCGRVFLIMGIMLARSVQKETGMEVPGLHIADLEKRCNGSKEEAKESEEKPRTPGRKEMLFHAALERHRNDMVHKTSRQVWTMTLCGGWWIPMIFVFAAVNVKDTCELSLDTFLEVFGGLSLILFPLTHTVMVLPERSGSHACAESAKNILVLMCIAALALIIAGWVIWDNTTDHLCYDGKANHPYVDLNPRTLLLVWLLLCVGGLSIFTCAVLCRFLSMMGCPLNPNPMRGGDAESDTQGPGRNSAPSPH